jgi:hypothetical protein
MLHFSYLPRLADHARWHHLVVKSVSGNAQASQVGTITGGTGQLASMRGSIKGTANFNIQLGP